MEMQSRGTTAAMTLAAFIGLTVSTITVGLDSAPFDPLLISLMVGILFGGMLGHRFPLWSGVPIATRWLIPVGIVFYALVNLDVANLIRLPGLTLATLLMVMSGGFITIVFLGWRGGQRRQITCLIAAGTAVCGASAIAMSAPSVEAEPDDVSVSLLAVTLAALLGLFIVLPFVVALLSLPSLDYGVAAGALLQFTGFVKEAVTRSFYLFPDGNLTEARQLAMAVKSARYFGLLIAIPLFASMAHKRIVIPKTLWLFVGAGVAGSLLRSGNDVWFVTEIKPLLQPFYLVLWSTAMAAIGLSADFRTLLSRKGWQAFKMAIVGFGVALALFLLIWSLMAWLTGGMA